MIRKQWLSFAALGLIWGSTWIPAQVIASEIPAIFAEATRLFLAALFLLPIILWKRLPLPGARALRSLLLLSATMNAGPFLILFWARQNLPSATVAVLFAAMPLLVVLLTPVLGLHDVPRSVMPAAIVGLGAIAFAMGASVSTSQALAASILLVAVVSISASILVIRRELSRVHPLLTTAVLLAAASLLLFLASLALERGQPAHWNRQANASLFFLASIGGALAYAIWFWLLQQWPAYQAATLQWVQPLIAMIEAALLLRLRLSWPMISGALVTLVCVCLVLRARTQDDDTVSLVTN